MLIPEIVKKHCMTVNAIKENTRDNDAVRKAFRCAFNALPASSPSIPKKSASTGELFLRFSCNSPEFFIASSGVILLNFLAGIHAEIHIVRTVINNVITNTRG